MKAIPILALLVLMLSVSVSSALAVTDFTLDWTGGNIAGTFVSGDDAVAKMGASGYTAGTFYAKGND